MNSVNKKSAGDSFVKTLRNNLLFVFLWIWLFYWVSLAGQRVKGGMGYYQSAIHSSPEELRATHSIPDDNSRDFYAVLRACDLTLPLGEGLQIILPQEDQKKFAFFTGKARYILYPRNFGDNAALQRHILVYQVKNFHIPEGYQVIRSFGPDRYLLTNRGIE